MEKLPVKTLKTIRNVIVLLGIVIGFLIWWRMPMVFKNTSLYHSGNGEYGLKFGALPLLLLQFLAFIPGNNKEEIHTEDPEERAMLEEESKKKELSLQIGVAVVEALVIWAIMGLAVAKM